MHIQSGVVLQALDPDHRPVKFNKSAGVCAGRNTITTNPYYFPVMTVPVPCLGLSAEVGNSSLPVTLPFCNHTRFSNS